MMASLSRLHLSIEANDEGNSIVRVKQQDPPWRVVRGFPTQGGETLAHIHNVSGGILDTDALHWQVDVAPRAFAQITSTGATRVYRSRSADRVATQKAIVTVAEDAYLEYLPDQLIPFAGARFEQSARIELKQGASVIWWDMVAPGREASGESFLYESLACTLELIACGEQILTERWTIAPLVSKLDSATRLGPFRHFASCYVCRAGEPAVYWREFESELQRAADSLSGPEILWGVSSLKAHGLVIRGVAVSGRSLSTGLVELWKAAKWFLCGRVATLPRKVH